MPIGSQAPAVGDINLNLRTVTGTITSATSVVGPVDVSDAAGALVTFHGTYVGVTANFEISDDNATWYLAAATNITGTSSPAGTTALGTNASTAFQVELAGAIYLRIRASLWTSGTTTVIVTPVGAMTEPSVVIGNSPTVNAQQSISTASNGATTSHHLISAATTNSTLVKATAAAVANIVLANASAAVKFFKVYDKATAPTVGTDTPTMVVAIPPTSTVSLPLSIYYRTTLGLGYGITGGMADADATAVAASDVAVWINYA